MAEGTSNYLYFSLLKFTQTISFTPLKLVVAFYLEYIFSVVIEATRL